MIRISAGAAARLAPLPLVAGLAGLGAFTPARALTTVCTADWQAPSVSAGQTKTATILAGSTGCPSSVTASITVGSGANAGTVNGGDAITGQLTSGLSSTSTSSVDLGVQATNPTNEPLTLTFSQSVSNPYLFFAYLDANTSFTFTDAFELVSSNNALASGNTISGTGGTNSKNDGFVVRMLGAFTTINFAYNNTSGSVQSVAFTTGVAAPSPGPLPLLGAGVAFSLSRGLRRRIRSC